MSEYKFDHDYHIHSELSRCSADPSQSTERILSYARENGLAEICLTDHYWDSAVPCDFYWYQPQNFEHISRALPLPKAEEVRFMFGCETDINKELTLGTVPERFSDFDFIIIPTTHLHMTNFTIREEDKPSCERRAALWVERLDALLEMELPFHKIGIAHLACSLINNSSRGDYLKTLSLLPDGEMERLFARAASLGCGIELNRDDMSFSDGEADTVLRPFRIAKNQGCKFYLGSDAHHPSDFSNARAVFERAVDMLGLSESDKFHVDRF
ncbi:MAG: PHP domain-containing protein [Clostridia bacterium]|nr:PHP domain-containing protein [Clostridia bacterium]